MVPSSLITDLAKAIYALLTRFSGCFKMMGKPSSPDSVGPAVVVCPVVFGAAVCHVDHLTERCRAVALGQLVEPAHRTHTGCMVQSLGKRLYRCAV